MKTKLPPGKRATDGYALIIVLGIVGVSLVMLSATINRTTAVQKLNAHNNQYVGGICVAEAATEKVFAKIAYDWQTFGAPTFNANLPSYRTNYPNEDAFWTNYVFSDGRGNINQTYVGFVTNYSGALPSQYPGLFTINSPVYRLLSNVQLKVGGYNITNAVQVDVLLARIPITTYAIFYNNLLEFSTCATMTVNGRVHANDKIYTGTSSTLTFNSTVTASSTLSSPYNNGSGPWTFPGGVFNGSPKYSTNVPTVALSIPMTNAHFFIEMPTTNDASTDLGRQRLYNQSPVILLVSNTTVTVRIQSPPDSGTVAGEDPSPAIMTFTNTVGSLMTNLPFLTLTNKFLDQREDKTNLVTQIDIGKYATWLTTNTSVTTEYPSGGANGYPNILYVADKRTNAPTQLPSIRLTNGIAPPKNNGTGFTVATPNPLYVWGDYNQTNSSYLATTNTTSGTVPCSFICDALTILSSSWSDATSYTNSQSGPNASSAITINAAILAGIVPSTGTNAGQFSGGVHNLPRLLENWGSSTVWLNTSIINLYNSTMATNKFVTPGTDSYYTAPTRKFSFDLNFMDPAKQPPGVPTALVAIRYNWGVPPPGTTNYNVIP